LLQIQIGNADYNCSCLRYPTSEDDVTSDLPLVVGLSVGFLLLLIVVVIIVVVYRRRRNKTTKDKAAKNDNGAGSIELRQDDSFYDTVPEIAGSLELEGDGTHYSTIPSDSYCSPGLVNPDENEYRPIETSHYLNILPDDEC